MSACASCGAAALVDGVCPRCLLERPLPELRIGPYLLGEELGSGGMGTVFRAEDTRSKRAVAIKLLAPEWLRDLEMRARLQREARALALFSHPNIVRLLESGEDQGQPYLVMELVEGRSLAGAGKLEPRRACALGAQLCDALEAAHARGLVHRDVKPANILLDRDGNVRLADFGIARALDGSDAITRSSLQAGTPEFLAPELLEGRPASVRSDLFAAGVVLHQWVTGALPRGELDRLPPRLEPIVRQALSLDPQRRQSGARELGEQLRRAEKGFARDERETGSRSGNGSAGRPASRVELPEEERFFVWGAALLCTAASAVALLAGLQSLSPRLLTPGELLPLAQLVTERLPDGRFVSRARFEPGPILFAALALAVAFAALALLRRHWRRASLDVPEPEARLPEVRSLRTLALVILASWLTRRLAESRGLIGPAVYMPVFGGLLLLIALYLFFAALLRAWRTARPLRREPWLFLSMALAVVPPVAELALYLARWTP